MANDAQSFPISLSPLLRQSGDESTIDRTEVISCICMSNYTDLLPVVLSGFVRYISTDRSPHAV